MSQFGLVLPNVSFEETNRVSELTSLAGLAERLGFTHLWTFDRLFHHNVSALEPFTVLSHVAAVTSKVKLGTSVAILTYRNPFILAKVIATFDALSNGRAVIGLSLGRYENEFRASGVDPSKKVRVFVDALNVMKSLWTGEQVDYDGPFWRALGAVQLPVPVQKPHPPILLGGAADGVLKRAARLADGWIGGGMLTPEELRAKYRIVLEEADKIGRKNKPILGKILYVNVNNDEIEAAAYLKKCFKRYYGTEIEIERYAAVGPPDRCVSTIKKYLDAGADLLALAPIPTTHDHVETLWNEVLSTFMR
ncbi:MAG: TIGR03619 family F420-dependent LLM class oxidoreductase [Nitrososphaerota archaeon]|nr:TIGR03619 family F420-dependent LLM class oxidoreductase [Nitrososphaerota archaeon]